MKNPCMSTGILVQELEGNILMLQLINVLLLSGYVSKGGVYLVLMPVLRALANLFNAEQGITVYPQPSELPVAVTDIGIIMDFALPHILPSVFTSACSCGHA